jgi:hypothetical protein
LLLKTKRERLYLSLLVKSIGGIAWDMLIAIDGQMN